ncbi:MAG: SpaA isopeptide-forming pilin-related protein, partial [Planctomycetota bacterium]|nr:SpaA isopeptide-forming pilin-related protein [Planctomycetota bacterium]
MGFLTKAAELFRGVGGKKRKGRLRQLTETSRRCVFEVMEPRQLLAVTPLYVGATYLESDTGSDHQGDIFEITFEGGTPDTELTHLVINGDQNQAGLGYGDMIFDTVPDGLGAGAAFPFTVVSLTARDPLAAPPAVQATIADGSSQLVLDFHGFHAGDKLTFSIDVDEVQRFSPTWDLQQTNQNIDPIASGVEFAQSQLTASFSAPHYHDANSTSAFLDAYNPALTGTGLRLPSDEAGGYPDRSAGAVGTVLQQPLPIAISGTVYLEQNLDLVRNAGELGLPGVQLELWKREDLGPNFQATGFTTTTAADGHYTFGLELNLSPGVYQVREVQPDGLFSVGAIRGTVDGQPAGATVVGNPDVLTDIAILLGDQRGVDFDFAEARPAKISGYVYHDRNNDGRRDAGEEGLPNVPLQIVPVTTSALQNPLSVITDASGFYQVSALAPGTYRILETSDPPGFLDGLVSAGTVDGVPSGTAVQPGDRIESIFLGGGQAGVEYNFGELVPASLAGHVRLSDADGNCHVAGSDYPPVADVTVQLLDSTGQVLATTTTDTLGAYRFGGLAPGTYAVVETTPTELLDGDEHVGRVNGQSDGSVTANDTIGGIVLASAQTGLDYDFCEYVPASLAGYVYHDRNNNGRREAGETGIAGVQVTLWEAGGSQVATTTTDAQGRYQFSRQSAGVYSLVETQPADWVDGLDAAGTIDGVTVGEPTNPGDQIGDIRLRWGDSGVDYDFGELHYAAIEGSVHLTGPEGDCYTPGGSQPPVAGVAIVLQNDRGETMAKVTTDSQGRYRFDELLPGSYTVIESTPANLIDGEDHLGTVDGTTVGEFVGNDVIRGIAVTSGQHGLEYDFCEHVPASLSGFVYHDANNNGVFEVGENPIANVEITLRDAVGKTVATVRTKQDGSYDFSGLAADQYRLVETQPAGYLDGQDAAG